MLGAHQNRRPQNEMGFVKNIHFVGIGGVGMNGIAKVLLNLGYQVSGSDIRHNPATEKLEESGAVIFIGHEAANIEKADAIVVSTAIKPDNPELLRHRKNVSRLSGVLKCWPS